MTATRECLDCGHTWTDGVDTATGEVAPPLTSWRNLPDEFWDARPALEYIRQAAHARARSADAVLLCTLARICALTPPTVVLPAIVGGQASLNILGAVIASSGAGKSSAAAVARELVPIDRRDVVADLPLGSGEGLVDLYFEMVTETDGDGKKQRVKRQTKNGALVYLDEGQALAEMGNRKGATLMPTLRSSWGGETLGQANATVETYRVLPAHRYRMAIIVGFQVAYAADMLADNEGGTPQRFVYMAATDPNVPLDPPPWPGALPLDTPPKVHTGTTIDVDPDIARDLYVRQVLIQRGDYTPEALDSHADLGRLKVAALLGILDGRTSVEQDDWALAGLIMRTSASVRSWVIEEARAKHQASERAYTAKLAERETTIRDATSQRALEAGARALARKVHRLERPAVRSDLHKAVKSSDRQMVGLEPCIDLAIERGWIVADGDVWKPGGSQPA